MELALDFYEENPSRSSKLASFADTCALGQVSSRCG